MLDSSLWKKLSRGPQVIALKDAATIASKSGLQSGDRVLDAGAGSGWLAIYLGSIVAPTGSVVSYERKSEFAALASKNVSKAGLDGVVTVKEKDIFEGIEESELDLISLDLAESEKVLADAQKALKMRGIVAGYFPTVEQAQRFVMEAERLKFKHLDTLEVTERSWKVRSFGSRPEHTGMTFTALLTFLQKIPEEEFDRAARELDRSKDGRRTKRIKEKLHL